MESIKFFTSKEIQRLLRISAATLHRLCSTGELSSIRLGETGHYRISEKALQEFLARSTTKKN